MPSASGGAFNPAINHAAYASLCDLAPGQTARIVGIDGGRQLLRKCLGLGLRVGAEVAISQRRGNGIVVASGGSRIALGRAMASKLLVEPTVDD